MQFSRTINMETVTTHQPHGTKYLTSQSPTYQKWYTGCCNKKSAIKLFTFTFWKR